MIQDSLHHHSIEGRLTRWFSSPLTLLAIVAALIICFLFVSQARLPQMDDILLTEFGSLPWVSPGSRLLSLYTLVEGKPEYTQMIVEYLGLPWWTDPQIKINFFRALTAVTHLIDFKLWRNNMTGMSLHSILWYALMVTAAYHFFKRLLPGRAPVILATFFFALNVSHVQALIWVANRTALLTATFAALTLLLHHRWRSEGNLSMGLLAMLTLILGFFSGEAALATCAFLFSYTLFMDRKPGLIRFTVLIPYAVIAFVWFALYKSAGHGSSGTSFYLDPGDNLPYFLVSLIKRYPLLLFTQWSGIPVEFLPRAIDGPAWSVVFMSASFFALITVLLWPLLKCNASARFLFLGILLALIPACTAPPQSRMLVLTNIAAAGLLAQFLLAWSNNNNSIVRSGAAAAACAFLWIMHGIIHPLAFIAVSISTPMVSSAETLESINNLPMPEIPHSQQIVYVNPIKVPHLAYQVLLKRYLDEATPEKNYSLTGSPGPYTITRQDEYTLTIASDIGFTTHTGTYPLLFRSFDNPVKAGEQFTTGDIEITVLAVDRFGIPKKARYVFDKPLEDSKWLWMQWSGKDHKTKTYQPPAIGELQHLDSNSI